MRLVYATLLLAVFLMALLLYVGTTHHYSLLPFAFFLTGGLFLLAAVMLVLALLES